MEKSPTPLWVVAAAIADEEGRWLMQRRPLHKHHGGLWEFPGGKVESGETPAIALCREIAEELGIDLDARLLKPASFAESSASAGDPGIVILLYTVEYWAGVPVSREGGAIGWFTPGEIASLDKPELDIVLAERLFAKWGG